MRKITLTPEQWKMCRTLYDTDHSIRDVAEAIGINATTLSFIFRREGFWVRTTAESQRTKRVREKRVKALSGANNPQYKGDKAQPHTGRARAKKSHPIMPDHCQKCGCHKSETKRMERHHIDENPLNNEGSNILWLCAKCHKSMHPHPRWGSNRDAEPNVEPDAAS